MFFLFDQTRLQVQKVATTEKLSCHLIATTRCLYEGSLEKQKATFYGSFLFVAPPLGLEPRTL